MEYVFLIYGDETAPLTPEQEQQMWAAHGAYSQMLADRLGRDAEASVAYQRALALARSPADRELLLRRLSEVSSG
jgi:predicted RNA polymerase sigma factor